MYRQYNLLTGYTGKFGSVSSVSGIALICKSFTYC